MNSKKILSMLLLICVVFAGCQSQVAVSSSNETDSNIQKILVGTEGTYNPFNFIDEDGEFTGYDIDVLREVDKRLDDVEFDYVAAQWDSLFLGLESKKYDMVADQISKNPEREEKYWFSDESYFSSRSHIIVRKDDDSIETMEDLTGKKAGVSVGTTFAQILEEYNEKNNNPFTIQYYEGNITSTLQDIETGRLDATINDKIIALDAIDELGLKIKVVGEPVTVTPSYFIYRKDDEGEALRDKIDEVLVEMKSDGTLAEISIKWFGEDLT